MREHKKIEIFKKCKFVNPTIGTHVSCINCHKVNYILPYVEYEKEHWASSIDCYQCRKPLTPPSLAYRKRRGKWVQIPPEWFGTAPSDKNSRDRKTEAKAKKRKVKARNGKIISKAEYRKIDQEDML